MNATRRTPRKIAIDSDAARMASGVDGAPSGNSIDDSPAPAAKPDPAPRAAPTPTKPPVMPTPPAEPNPDALEGEAYPGEPTVKVGLTLPASLKGQLDGFVRFAQDTGEVPDVTFAVDAFRIAVARYVREAQNTYNNGEPFTAPRVNRRGRSAQPHRG